MKYLVNISSIIIMLLSFSSITSAQSQKRPSQRSFAMVLAKIKEKKNGRDKMQKEQAQSVNTVGKVDEPLPKPGAVVLPMAPTPLSPEDPDPVHLPSRQIIRMPSKPKGSG